MLDAKDNQKADIDAGVQDDDDNDSEWESCSSSENDQESWEDCSSDSDSLSDDLDKKSNG